MQPVISIEKITLKKPKSLNFYAKKQSSYIVAFAMNETTKAPSTEIAHESSLRNGIAITESISTKTMKFSKENINDTPVANDSTTRIKENCGDSEERCTNTLNNTLNCLEVNENISQPQVIFIAQKHTRKTKFEIDTNYKKLKKCKPVVIIKNIRFKNQRARNITSKLKRYCNQSKKTYDGSHKVNKELNNESISKRVSRTRILKKVLAKENFLAEDNHNPPDTTSPFDGDLSFISISSQGTLKQEDSPHSINSIIEVTDRKITSFNKNIINVAVAQITHTPNLSRNSYSIIVPHKEKAVFKDSLTSYESAFSQTLILTSKSFLNDPVKLTSKNTLSDASCSNSNISNETLIPPKARSTTSHNTFEIHNTLVPQQTDNDIYSCSTAKCSFSYQTQDNTSFNNCQSSYKNEIKGEDLTRTLYDGCMTFDIYPKTRPCSSSVPDFPSNDNVIIAEDILKTTQQIQNIKNRGDKRFGDVKNDFHTNIFHKPFNVDNAEDYQKNFNLPNAAQIKSNIVDTSRQQRKCSQEVNDYPGGFPELCDKLTIILEIAVKKLEQTLSEKIVNELKRSLYEIDNHIKSITKFQEKITSEYMTKDIKLGSTTKSEITLQTMPQIDANLQCDIVRNEVIDKFMLTFNEETKSCVQSSSSNYTHKLKKPKLVKNYFDILKNSLSFHYKEPEVGKGESVQISIEDSVEEKEPQFGWKKTFFTLPITILRENMLVVASVPAFLFVMFVVYSYIMLLIRMWWY